MQRKATSLSQRAFTFQAATVAAAMIPGGIHSAVDTSGQAASNLAHSMIEVVQRLEKDGYELNETLDEFRYESNETLDEFRYELNETLDEFRYESNETLDEFRYDLQPVVI